MNVEQVKEWIAAGNIGAVESEWLAAVEHGAPLAELSAVLESLVAAGHLDAAETCATMMLSERGGDAPASLEMAKAFVAAVPVSDQLRAVAADLYRKLHAAYGHLEDILKASGLLTGQSPRRAFRTLDVCLTVRPETYLANRFDSRCFKVKGYNAATGEFELADASGTVAGMEPKAMADELDPVGDHDFRVLCQHRRNELGSLLEEDPSAVLVGICQMHGGSIAAPDLKDHLVPQYLGADDWSGWWNRARTAAKRSRYLSLDGRSPIVVSYHPQGRTLEEELSGAAQAARMPLDMLAVLQQYAREARGRKLAAVAAFAAPMVEAMAEQARSFREKRPADAMAAALAVEAAAKLGLPRPASPCPSAAEVLASARSPAQAVAQLGGHELFPQALEALAARPDAGEQLEAMLELVPAWQLDRLAERLGALGRQDAVARAASRALADAFGLPEVFVWLWKGPAAPPPGMPGKVELLARLLKALQTVQHDWNVDHARRKEFFQRMRSALGDGDCASYRQAVAEMDEGVAGTVKRLIERCQDALAESVFDRAMHILREHHPGLFFARQKVQPWMDEDVIWITQAALDHKQAEYKELTEVKMLANARAIGAAAAHGDLSENSEWKFALEERDMLRARAAKMQEELAKARVIRPEHVPPDAAGIGSRVVLRRLEDGAELELTFLGPWDSNLEKRVFSYQSQLAQELMGRSVGETLTLKMDDRESQYRIERLDSAVK